MSTLPRTKSRTTILALLPALLLALAAMTMLVAAQSGNTPPSGGGTTTSRGEGHPPAAVMMTVQLSNVRDPAAPYYVIGQEVTWTLEVYNGLNDSIVWSDTYTVTITDYNAPNGATTVHTEKVVGSDPVQIYKILAGDYTKWGTFQPFTPKPTDPTLGAKYKLHIAHTMEDGTTVEGSTVFEVLPEPVIVPSVAFLEIRFGADPVAPGDVAYFDLVVFAGAEDLIYDQCCPGSFGWTMFAPDGTTVLQYPDPKGNYPAVITQAKIAAYTEAVIGSAKWDQVMPDGSKAPLGDYTVTAWAAVTPDGSSNTASEAVKLESKGRFLIGELPPPTPYIYLELLTDQYQYEVGDKVVLTTVVINPTTVDYTVTIGGCLYDLIISGPYGNQVYPAEPVACIESIQQHTWAPGKHVLGEDVFVAEENGWHYATVTLNVAASEKVDPYTPDYTDRCAAPMPGGLEDNYYYPIRCSVIQGSASFQVGKDPPASELWLELTTDKVQYKLGESVIIVTSVVNPSQETVTMTFSTPCASSLSIVDSSGNPVYLSDEAKQCVQYGAPAELFATSFPPGVTPIAKDLWTPKEEGTYYATAVLSSIPAYREDIPDCRTGDPSTEPVGCGSGSGSGTGVATGSGCAADSTETCVDTGIAWPEPTISGNAIIQVGEPKLPPKQDQLIVETDKARYDVGEKVQVKVWLPNAIPIADATGGTSMAKAEDLAMPWPLIVFAKITTPAGETVWTWSPNAYQDEPYDTCDCGKSLPEEQRGGGGMEPLPPGTPVPPPMPPSDKFLLAEFAWDQMDLKGSQAPIGSYKVTVWFGAGEKAGSLSGSTTFGLGTKEPGVDKPSITVEVLATPHGQVAVASSSIGIIVLGALIAGTEIGKLAFLTLFAPLYTRLRREEVLDQFLRGKIQGYVIANPGEHYNHIREVLEISNGTLAYHLRVLEREGYIRSMRDGMYKRYYPAGEKLPTKKYLNLAQSAILNQIRQEPGVSQTEIAERMATSVQVVNYYVQRLWRMDLLTLQKDGRKTRCFVREDKLQQQEDGRFFIETDFLRADESS